MLLKTGWVPIAVGMLAICLAPSQAEPANPHANASASGGRCPVTGAIQAMAAMAASAEASSGDSSTSARQYAQTSGAMTLDDWWPERLRLEPLHKNSAKSSPLGPDFNYAQEFNKLDLAEVKKDIEKVLKSTASG